GRGGNARGGGRRRLGAVRARRRAPRGDACPAGRARPRCDAAPPPPPPPPRSPPLDRRPPGPPPPPRAPGRRPPPAPRPGRGLAARGHGDVLRAPYVLLLGGAVRPDSLRAKGIPAIAWDSGRLVVGAFESPEQAALTEARLRRAGIPATLVTRMGTTP